MGRIFARTFARARRLLHGRGESARPRQAFSRARRNCYSICEKRENCSKPLGRLAENYYSILKKRKNCSSCGSTFPPGTRALSWKRLPFCLLRASDAGQTTTVFQKSRNTVVVLPKVGRPATTVFQKSRNTVVVLSEVGRPVTTVIQKNQNTVAFPPAAAAATRQSPAPPPRASPIALRLALPAAAPIAAAAASPRNPSRCYGKTPPDML